jgi:RNA polymerase sigma factor (sigma-70 family)
METRRASREERVARMGDAESHRRNDEDVSSHQFEITRHVRKLVRRLPARQYTVLYLRYWCELSPRQIARHLEIGIREVRSLQSSAIAFLRRGYLRNLAETSVEPMLSASHPDVVRGALQAPTPTRTVLR